MLTASSFGFRHSFVIGHSGFVIFNDAFIQCAKDRLLLLGDFLTDKDQLSSIGLERFQFPAARREIEKLRATGEADETLRANDARGQAICKVLETIARKNFTGCECERFEFGLMPMCCSRGR